MEERSRQEEDVLFNSIFGVPQAVAESFGVEKIETAQLDAVLNALGEAKDKEEKFMKDNFSYFVEYAEENRKELEEVLDFYFKDRWELQIDPGGSSLDSIKKVVNAMTIPADKLKNRKQFFEFLVRERNYSSIHNVKTSTLLIHFPEINITNRSRHKHKIVDLWMKFKFNSFYRLISMGGTRSSKSYAEFNAGYNHSHMPSQRECGTGVLSCCLGETHYRTLQTQLFSNFDKTDMTLFMQQLQDYLAWESLDGGPHIRMEYIGNRDYNVTSNRNYYLNGNVMNQAYQDFLRKYPNGYSVSLEDNGFYFKFKIIKDEAFKEKVTEVCPEQYKMLYDTVQKKQYTENNSDGSSANIQRLNEEYGRQPMFNFKGKPIYFQILDPNAGIKRDTANIVKVAPDQLINHIAASLEQGINKYYVKKFQEEFLSKK